MFSHNLGPSGCHTRRDMSFVRCSQNKRASPLPSLSSASLCSVDHSHTRSTSDFLGRWLADMTSCASSCGFGYMSGASPDFLVSQTLRGSIYLVSSLHKVHIQFCEYYGSVESGHIPLGTLQLLLFRSPYSCPDGVCVSDGDRHPGALYLRRPSLPQV